jgi:hypothetical protein
MYYYHFKFNPQDQNELTEITAFINFLKSRLYISFSKNKFLIVKSDKNIGKEIFEYAKEGFNQDFEVEIQIEEPRESKLLQYMHETGAIITQHLLPFFDADYLCELFDKSY